MFLNNFLVTGGCGFIGSHVVKFLLSRGSNVTVIDNLSTGRAGNLESHENLTILDFDLLDNIFSLDLKKIDCIIHLAANADIRDGMSHTEKDIQQNIVVTERVARLATKLGVKDIIFSSTAAVLGEPEIFPTPEDAPIPMQTSLYGMSKLAAEGILSTYSLNFGLRVSVFRFVSIVGPRYSHGHVIDFFRKLKADEENLSILGDGKQKKSYLHVSDLIAAVEIVLTTHKEETETFFEVYNLGNDEFCTVTESAQTICGALGVNPVFSYSGGSRGWVGDSPFVHLETKKLKKLGWRPRKTIHDAIRSTALWLNRSTN